MEHSRFFYPWYIAVIVEIASGIVTQTVSVADCTLSAISYNQPAVILVGGFLFGKSEGYDEGTIKGLLK